MQTSRLAYISFDTVPAPKGAAVHIEAFARALGHAFGEVQLVTVATTTTTTPAKRIWPGVWQSALPAIGDTLINRVLAFRAALRQWWQGRKFEAVQIRSIYEGLPIALQKRQLCNFLIFEVNGLPSIELKYRYPAVADDPELLQKLFAQEQICLEAADLIVTPSAVTRDYLVQRGVAIAKIRVIPNGVDLEIFRYQSPNAALELSPLRLLYFGTLSAWQGVTLAVEALGLYCRDFPAELTVIGPSREQQLSTLQKLAFKLGVSDRLKILDPVSQAELVAQMHQADAIVAPLTSNDRNLIQGCCPLKVLEGMASGTPVITSDLPVVRELGMDGVHFLLVQPGSAKAIKDALLRFRTEPNLRIKMAIAARQQIAAHYTWAEASVALVAAYEELGIKRAKIN
jgi:glycosyltransferase involved in cell wall biosynthesis